MSHGPFLASLCSHEVELTPRAPVTFNRAGDPLWHYVGPSIDNGVGDRLAIWCADCGGFVRECKLLKLVAVDGGRSQLFDLPALPMVRERAEA